LIYIDDSGDTGLPIKDGSRTKAFVLSALAVKDTDWLATLDQMQRFRRWAKASFGLPMRAELKAGYLIHGTGPFNDLHVGDAARMRLYRQALRFEKKLGTLTVWAVLIDKPEYERQRCMVGVREWAWSLMIERIESFTRYKRETCIVFPDEGHPEFVRQKFRKMRRFHYVSSAYNEGMILDRPADIIIEDPNFRRSRDSYFVQFADLNSYAAHRHVFPEPYFGSDNWCLLDIARNTSVNAVSRKGPAGIVVRPHPAGVR
jgi:hypothetical protein